MNYVFTTTRLIMGGIETLIMRMSDWLIDNGHNVTIVSSEGGSQVEKISPQVQVYTVGSVRFNLACYPVPLSFLYSDDLIKSFRDADVVMSFTEPGCMFSYHMCRSSKSQAKVVSGVFEPSMFLGSYEYFDSIFWHTIHNKNKFYMNQVIVDINKEQGKFTDGVKVWPLPINVKKFIPVSKQNIRKNNVILSIGRLDRMKGYNVYMPSIIRDLIDAGYKDIEWHIIGDDETNGLEPTKAEMLEQIKKYKIESHVKMLGIVDYSNLINHLGSAKVFVGMGTAAVEASSAGIPSICAIIHEYNAKTYGFLWDQPEGCVGERWVGVEPTKDVKRLITHILSLDEEDYKSLSEKSVNHSLMFDIDKRMEEFIKCVDESDFGFNLAPKGRLKHIFKKSLRYSRKLF